MLVVLGLAWLSGCATLGKGKTIRPGDRVEVHLTCMTDEGQLLYDTHAVPERTEEQPDPASLFFGPAGPGPQVLTAGSDDPGPLEGKLKTFAGELKARVAVRLPGMTPDGKQTLTLDSAAPDGLTDEDRYLALTLQRRYPLTRTVGRIPFTKQLGREPEPGMDGPSMGPLKTRIIAVTPDQVTFTFEFTDGDTLPMPFGPGRLSHDPDGEHYIVDIDARAGRPVKMASLLGQIVRVGDDRFVIDYGHPFGGKTLTCDVEIVSVRSPQGENP
ncbi:hypothetical protein JCM14469_14580 [Desulfatiferula olefinivorans]